MKNIIPLILSMFVLFGCNNEEFSEPRIAGLQVNAEFLKLSDNTDIAGQLMINADVPEVTVRWNTNDICNLDTTQTVLRVSKGKAILPVKWMNKQKNGTYGPEGIAFKAGVQITAGKHTQYIPLVWAERIDSTEVLKNVQTRSLGDIMPRVAQISMLPLTVNLNYANGGTMLVTLNDVSFAVFDLSEFTSDMNLDLSTIPNYTSDAQTILNFKWTAAGPPTYPFSARIIAMAEGIMQTGIVNYTPDGGITPGNTLNFVNSNLPTGNIPQAGGTYTFTFDGTYAGNVQVRAIGDGTILVTGTSVNNKRPSVAVPQNTGTVNRNITFQYKREDGEWTNLPATTNRVQAISGGGIDPNPDGGIAFGGYTWAPGNLVRVGGVYKFYASQSESSYSWSGGDYWNWNTLDPTNYTVSAGYWNNANDPCGQVSPAGTWKTPSSAEMQVLVNAQSSWGNMNGKPGRYFGANNQLFLQATGWRYYGTTTMSNTSVASLYWTSSSYSTSQAYCLGIQNNNVRLDGYIYRNMGVAIRCIKR